MTFKQTYAPIDTSVIKHRGPTGPEVRVLRKLNRLTQAEFANAIGYSRQAVNQWERNIFQAPRTLLAEMEMKGLQTRVFNTTQAFALYDMFRRANFNHADTLVRMATAINDEKSCTPFTQDDMLAITHKYPDVLKT